MESKKVIIKVQREKYTTKTTIGKLYVNGVYVCDTLEDVCRDLNRDGNLNDEGETKVYAETAIPSGTYQLKIYDSPHFKQKLFWLQKVSGYDYVLIHSGNTAADTKGCILLGYNTAMNMVTDSRNALKKFHELVLNKYDEYELYLLDTPIVFGVK